MSPFRESAARVPKMFLPRHNHPNGVFNNAKYFDSTNSADLTADVKCFEIKVWSDFESKSLPVKAQGDFPMHLY